MSKLMEFYTTESKQRAITKLKKLFDKFIISNVYKTEDWIYTIERLSKDMFYISSVEAQKEMPKYLEYMIDKINWEEKPDIEYSDKEEEKQGQIEDLQNNMSQWMQNE